jgi:hypothetical protein
MKRSAASRVSRNQPLPIELFSHDQSCTRSDLRIWRLYAARPRYQLFRHTRVTRRGFESTSRPAILRAKSGKTAPTRGWRRRGHLELQVTQFRCPRTISVTKTKGRPLERDVPPTEHLASPLWALHYIAVVPPGCDGHFLYRLASTPRGLI